MYISAQKGYIFVLSFMKFGQGLLSYSQLYGFKINSVKATYMDFKSIQGL